MKIRISLILFLIGCFGFLSYGQDLDDDVQFDQTNTWFFLLNKVKLNDKWSLENELHERTGAFLSQQGTFLWRPSLSYHFNNKLSASLGYSLLINEPNEPNPRPIAHSIENNFWEQFQWKGKWNLTHRFRQEHRWSNKFSNRFRYRITWTHPIGEGPLFITVFNEFWINQKSTLIPEKWSRNWTYLGLGYQLNHSSNLQLGYMNQFDFISEDFKIVTPIVQTTLVHNF